MAGFSVGASHGSGQSPHNAVETSRRGVSTNLSGRLPHQMGYALSLCRDFAWSWRSGPGPLDAPPFARLRLTRRVALNILRHLAGTEYDGARFIDPAR